MQRVKNMDKNFKFVYVMIILLSLFIVSTQMTYKRTIFISFLNFLLYFVNNILSHFNNIIFSLFFITGIFQCKRDRDCPSIFGFFKEKYRCRNGFCSL
jgi:hypothetical protein